jgi:hypothetical protein
VGRDENFMVKEVTERPKAPDPKIYSSAERNQDIEANIVCVCVCVCMFVFVFVF